MDTTSLIVMTGLALRNARTHGNLTTSVLRQSLNVQKMEGEAALKLIQAAAAAANPAHGGRIDVQA